MSPIDRRLITHANWGLIGFTTLLFFVGAANLYSASGIRMGEGLEMASYYQKQFVWGAIGIGIMVLTMSVDYRHLKSFDRLIYIGTIVLLLMVLGMGKSAKGAARWLHFGGLSLQPSELAKISVLIMGANFLSATREPLGWARLAMVLLIGLVPAALIFRQPDLGTCLLVLLLLGGMILYKGVRPDVLKGCCIIGPLLLPIGWFFLKPYQKQRIMTFWDPAYDPLQSSYHINQSHIAIGSGQIWGKGFLEGTQNQLRFLPEKHTDFAISVFGEEWGFVGCMLLLALFCFFLMSILNTARDAKDRFGSILTAGVFFYFFWQVFINMGMTMGLLPVVGIPLPFISYGGSATLVNFSLLGLVLNVSMRRFVFKIS
ncbi:MAG: rod shape-determining protein RodA [Deltaproteobacteria bacterium]|jgi:rod shape determining protein RodA|nr:rod shape-determining protein RodA [Deltaproteobacteria bacterium]